jgi:anti-sigma-K factor RskA
MTSDGRDAMTGHEEFADALSAYALDAMDGAERRAFEAHLASCRQCQDELAELRRVTAGIGLATAPEAPPAPLRARTLRHATAQPRAAVGAARRGGSLMPWLLAAAAVFVAVVATGYALALRTELDSVSALASAAAARVETLRAELLQLREDSARLRTVVNIVNAPDVRQARLAGSGEAAGATGRAFWSQSTGLVFNAAKLPQLAPDRSYELWVIPPGADATPVSGGVLTVAADGTATHAVPLPAGVPAAAVVAVTIEAAGGSPDGVPHGAVVLAGNLRS